MKSMKKFFKNPLGFGSRTDYRPTPMSEIPEENSNSSPAQGIHAAHAPSVVELQEIQTAESVNQPLISHLPTFGLSRGRKIAIGTLSLLIEAGLMASAGKTGYDIHQDVISNIQGGNYKELLSVDIANVVLNTFGIIALPVMIYLLSKGYHNSIGVIGETLDKFLEEKTPKYEIGGPDESDELALTLNRDRAPPSDPSESQRLGITVVPVPTEVPPQPPGSSIFVPQVPFTSTSPSSTSTSSAPPLAALGMFAENPSLNQINQEPTNKLGHPSIPGPT